jgi:hypothetical protein
VSLSLAQIKNRLPVCVPYMQKLIVHILLTLALPVCYGQKKYVWLIPFNAHHRWGFATPEGQIIIPPRFDSVGLFDEGMAEAYRGNKLGLIDTKGQWVVPPRFSSAKILDKQKGLFEVSTERTDKEGYSDYPVGIYQLRHGLITPLRYRSIQLYKPHRYALEGMNGKNYLVDIRTHQTKRFRHNHYFDCGCGRAYIEMQKKEVAYQRYLQTKGPLEALHTLHYTYENGKMGGYYIYDTAYDYKAGQWVKFSAAIPAIYDTLFPVNDDEQTLILARLNNRWGIVDTAGKTTLPIRFDKITLKVSEGYVAVKEKGKSGIYRTTGQPIFDCIYDSVIMPCKYYDFLFAAKKDGNWTIKNKRGQSIANGRFDRIGFHCNGQNPYAFVAQAGKYGVLDSNGILIAPMIYDDVSISDSFLIFKTNGLFGATDIKNNRPVFAPEWDMVAYRNEGYFLVGRENKYGVFLPQAKGKQLFFPIANENDIEVVAIPSLRGNRPFLAFGVTQNNQFYYVGENGYVFKQQ